MTIKPCLDSAVAQKEITQAAADELDLLFQRFVAQHALIHGPAEARRLAQEQIAKRLEASAAQNRRKALLQAQAIEGRDADISGYKDARGQVSIEKGLIELLETHGRRDEGLASGSLAGKQKAIFANSVAEFEGGLDALDKDILGRPKNKAMADNVVRELHGQATGDVAAKGLASVFKRVAEDLRQRFNENGGAIGFLEKWALPQHHDARALRNAGFDAWSQRISGLLDWEQMRHALTGDPILPDERMAVLQHVYDTISSEGWEGKTPSPQPEGRGALYKQHSDHRFLVFKDADAYLTYARDFGQPDVLATMMGYLKIMSRDIAAMELLGPDPEATLTWLKQKVLIEARKAERGEASLVPRKSELFGLELRRPVNRAQSAVNRAEAMWSLYNGTADVAVDNAVADFFTTARNFVTAGGLGSAMLSALSDQGFQAFARRFASGAGIVGSVLQQNVVLVNAMRDHFTGGEGTRAQALRAGILFEHLASTTGQQAREASAFSGPVISRYVADQVLKKQGLVAWTNTQRNGFGLFLMGEVADEAGKSFADMHPAVRHTLRRYGFSETDWQVMRAAGLHDMDPNGGGAHVLRAREIKAMRIEHLATLFRDEDLAGKAKGFLAEIGKMDERTFRQNVATAELPPVIRDMLGVSQLSLEETKRVVGRLVEQPGRIDPRALEGGPSIPSDPAELKVQRYFRDLSERYQEMLLAETDYAIPQATLRARSFTSTATKGTFMGEGVRSMAQFKGYGVGVALLQGGRIANELAMGRVSPMTPLYATAVIATMATYGMFSMQLKQFWKGEDVRDMSDWRTWGGALLQSGGAGIYGDFFLADQNRLGGSLAGTIAGPLFGRVEKGLKSSIGNVQQGAEGKKTNWQRESLNFIQGLDPLSSLWFTKLVWDRAIYGNLRQLADPEASQAFQRQVETARRDRGTGYWMRPGPNWPERLPEMGRSR